MPLLTRKINTEKLYRLLFLLLFWSMWLGWPFLNSEGHETFRRFMVLMIPVNLTFIPLFFFNTEWLIPKILDKRGVSSYVVSLFVMIAAVTVLHLLMKDWLLPEDIHHKHRSLYRTLIPVMFITAVSTGYGFITYLLDQEKRRREEKQERLQSELAFLRSQISPHFIFNILNSLVYLIRSRSELAEAVTIKLSELMRYMLYESADAQVLLDKEVDYLSNYIELQQLRFGEDVDIRFHKEGLAHSQTIEPMLMIPFVENAFKHGVGFVKDPLIDISLIFDEKTLTYIVKNKIAPDMPEDKDSSSGIGLRNVKRRLELLYPHSHQLTLHKDNEWFVAELQLHFSSQGLAISS